MKNNSIVYCIKCENAFVVEKTPLGLVHATFEGFVNESPQFGFCEMEGGFTYVPQPAYDSDWIEFFLEHEPSQQEIEISDLLAEELRADLEA